MKKNIENINLRQVQLSELELLKKIDAICKKNNIQYYLVGGTFLGAVRHKGFIPWDDDVDIGILRKDFEKFCELAAKDKTINFKSYKTLDDYNFYIPIVYDDNIDIATSSFVNNKIVHPWVDIFPYDNVPNNLLKRKLFTLNVMIIRALINLSAFDDLVKINKKDRPFYEKAIIFLGRKIKFSKILNTKKLLNKVDKKLKKYNEIDCEYISTLMGDCKSKETIPKAFYDEISLYEFEGLQFPAPSNYDGFLKHFYGDYTKMPSENERQSKHNIDSNSEVANGKS